MSAQAAAYVRMEGASLRQYVSKISMTNGAGLGLAVAKRAVWELCQLIGETHGPTVVHAMLDEARGGFQLDAAPEIIVAGQQDNLELVTNAIEGLSTISNQNREAIAQLTAAVGHLADEVRRGR